MAEPFLGEIRIFGFNFAPRGWAFCQGQLLPISQNTALFSILGTTFGGNGTTNFGLPDMQGRIPLSPGQGPGLTPYVLGDQTGTETVTLTAAQMAAHGHAANCFTGAGDSYTGGNALPAVDAGGNNLYSTPANAAMAAGELTMMGGGLAHNNLQPFLVMNYCIALQGIFPARS